MAAHQLLSGVVRVAIRRVKGGDMGVGRVAIVHPNRLFRESLEIVLTQERDFEVVGSFGEVRPVLNGDCTKLPDLVVIDLCVPQKTGLGEARQVRSVHPRPRVLMIGVPDLESEILNAIEAGAAGYLLCDASMDDLLVCIRAVTTGKALCSPTIAGLLFSQIAEGAGERRRLHATGMAHLTPKELEIISLIDRGLGNKEIATRLNIETQTVKNHVHSILDKLHVQGHREAARYARETGLLSGMFEKTLRSESSSTP